MSIWNENYEVESYDDLWENPSHEFIIVEGDVEDTRPTRLSMRKSLLKVNGRRKGLNSMWDVRRFDSPWVRSRNAGHPCSKDDRTYRPWQRDGMKTIRGVPDNDFNDWQDFVEGVLQSDYKDSEILVKECV